MVKAGITAYRTRLGVCSGELAVAGAVFRVKESSGWPFAANLGGTAGVAYNSRPLAFWLMDESFFIFPAMPDKELLTLAAAQALFETKEENT